MSKARVHLDLVVADALSGTAVRDAIELGLLGKDVFVHDKPIELLQQDDGSWHVVAQVRFNSEADANAWYADIQAKWTVGGVATSVLSASRASIHICPHDQPSTSAYSCVESPLADFRQVVK